MNFFQRLAPGQIQAEAAGRIGKIEAIQRRLENERIAGRAKELAARPVDSAAASLAQALNRGAAGAEDMVDTSAYGAYQQLVNAAGGVDPAKASASDPALLASLRGMDQGQRARVAQAQAQLEPRGPMGAMRGLEAEINRRLAADGVGGNVARGALYAGIGGGAVAGGMALTEGAQQLIALMQYLQSGQQSEERAQTSELA